MSYLELDSDVLGIKSLPLKIDLLYAVVCPLLNCETSFPIISKHEDAPISCGLYLGVCNSINVLSPRSPVKIR